MLGNELIKGYVHTSQMAKDFKELRAIVDTLWKTGSGKSQTQHRPFVAGADEIDNMEDFLKKTGPGVLDYATFHLYGQCGHDPIPHHPFPPISTPGFALQPDCLDKSAEDGIPGGVAQVHRRCHTHVHPNKDLVWYGMTWYSIV